MPQSVDGLRYTACTYMAKDFDGWSGQKKRIDEHPDNVHFHEREIWWCALGLNVGSEQDGVSQTYERPILVIRNFNNRVLWAVPLTRTVKTNRFFFRLDPADGQSAAVLSQLRLISSKRLVRKIRTLDEPQFLAITKALRDLMP